MPHLPSVRIIRLNLLLLCAVVQTWAQSEAAVTQLVTLRVAPISVLSVSGDPQPLLISTPDDPSAPLVAEDRSTRFDLTTTTSGRRIGMSIDAPMPPGTRLKVRLGAATGTSAGFVDISGALSPVEVVRDLRPGASVGQEIAYRFEADLTAGPVPMQSRTITMTVTE